MTISALVSIVPPPSKPQQVGDRRAWRSVCERLGAAFPDDYYDLVSVYGSGSFHDDERLRLECYSPFDPRFEDQIRQHGEMLEAFKADEGDDSVPFDLFPTTPGLLAVGSDDNGNELYWLTAEKPTDWTIVVRSPEGAVEEFDEQLTSFLSKVFDRTLACSIWPEPFFSDPAAIRFKSSAPVSASKPRNLYDLYVANGNKAGFWVLAPRKQRGFAYCIRLVNDKTEGPLPPTEPGGPAVVADLYFEGQLYRKDNNLSDASQPIFQFCDPPPQVSDA